MAKNEEIKESAPKKRGRKPGQKNKKKKAGNGIVTTQLVGELLIINLNGVTIKKVILVGGVGKETMETV